MMIKARLKEFSISGTELNISLFVDLDAYDFHVHSPKISIIFKTEGDMRRIPLPVDFYEPTETGSRIFGSFVYQLDTIFWNIAWSQCEVSFDVTFGNECFKRVPLQIDCEIQQRSGCKIQPDTDSIYIIFQKNISCIRPKNPNLFQTVLSFLCHMVTGLIGITLLPWFAVDSLAILLLGTETKNPEIKGSFARQFVYYVGWRYFGFCRNTKGITGAKIAAFKASFYFHNSIHKKKSKLLFFSDRRDELSGNFEFVYQEIPKKSQCLFWLHADDVRNLSIWELLKLGRYLAEAKVILIDDYMPLLDEIKIDPGTKVVQLWHACGAFKTFGFSRLGKEGGPDQTDVTHRYYDYAVVSSSKVVPCYAEGFGISEDKVLPLGVPRTDAFFDNDYAMKVRDKIYKNYPVLKEKRVILFAPTFRGNGKLSAYYDQDKFDPNQVIEAMPEDTMLIIKQHPFVHLKYEIKVENQDKVLDLSKKSEINDLLFVTDVLITDYSSVIYEASLLNIPMIFYAYDLREYIASRDTYFEYEQYVPGEIVKTQEQLIDALKNAKSDQKKIDEFKRENFEFLDGNSSKRVAKKVISLMDEPRG